MPDTYKRLLWIELIGFDNTLPDFGVDEFLSRTGFVPDVISFHLCCPDFIHTHEGLAEERDLPPENCSYGARPYSPERPRQVWTNWQLKALIEELHKHGVAVYCAVFDLFVNRVDGEIQRSPWTDSHPELHETNRRGERLNCLCPLHRFADGTYYGDFYAEKLLQVLRDYGFDGYHAADGYTSTRLPIYEVDFSDDVVNQFAVATGALPEDLARPCEGDPEAFSRRSAYIWGSLRKEWLRFYADRWTAFWTKIVAALRAEGRKIVFNNAWTRDPFQAYYRYGVDYRRIAQTGIDGFVAETVAAGVSIGAEGGAVVDARYDYAAMLMLMKACTPQTPIHGLFGTHDTNEEWDVLRHAPTVSERESYTMSNLYRVRSSGQYDRCWAGPMVCLADCLQAHEWQALRERWEVGFSGDTVGVEGATLVWSEAANAAQLEDYINTRRWTTHRLVYALTSHGAPVNAVVDIADLDQAQGPILVCNPHLFPEEELSRVCAYRKGPVLCIGGMAESLPEADFGFEDVYAPQALGCRVYGEKPEIVPSLVSDGEETIPDDLATVPEPVSFLQELYYRKVSESFVQACADTILACAKAPHALTRADVTRIFSARQADGTLRLFIGNDSYYYTLPQIETGREIESLRVRSSFPGKPVYPEGSQFRVKVPPRGMVVLDLTWKT